MSVPIPTEAQIDWAASEPVEWIETVLGDKPWSKQAEICYSVRDNRETAAPACHGAGKTNIAARIGLWFLYSHHQSVVISTGHRTALERSSQSALERTARSRWPSLAEGVALVAR